MAESNQQVEELHYPAALQKWGLEPNEFESCLTSKMEKLLENSNRNVTETIIKDSIKSFIQSHALKVRNDGNLDQRRSSNNAFESQGFGIDSKTSPRKIYAEKGKQGHIKDEKKIRNGYHQAQFELLDVLKEEIPNIKLNRPPKDEEPQHKYWTPEPNGRGCTTKEMCDEIDECTRYYIGEMDSSAEQEEFDPIEREKIRKVHEHCEFIVRGRVYSDCGVANDLLKIDGHKQWREHVWAIMSFAALFVIIDALLK